MTKQFQGESIAVDQIARLYPAAIMTLPDGDKVQVSIEWAEAKYEQINVTGFVLVFDFGNHTEEHPTKKEFYYDTFYALEDAIKEAALLLN